MDLRIFQPSSALEKYVYSSVYIRNDQSPFKYRIFPGGYSSIAFNLSGCQYRIKEFDDSDRCHSSMIIIGQTTKCFTVSSNGKTDIVIILFKPLGISQLFDISLDSITNSDIPLEKVIGPSIWEFYHSLQKPDIQKRHNLIEDFLKVRVKSENDEVLEQVINLIVERNGILSLKTTLKEIAISERTLQRKFKEKVGLSPKQYAKVIRLNYLLKIMKTGKTLSWNDVSYMGGYYDQMHFIKDFKAFTGITPSFFTNSDTVNLYNPFEGNTPSSENFFII